MPPQTTQSPAAERLARLRQARIYLIAESESGGRRLVDWVATAIEAGVDVVQLRDKERRPDPAVVAELRAIVQESGALFVVNDDPELAVNAEADGVHIGQDDLAPARAREIVGEGLVIGQSTHTPDQIAAANTDGNVDYIGVGPVFETPTKPGRSAVGTGLIEHAAANSDLPFFAIGGIDASTAPAVIAAGAGRIAVVRAIRDADDPAAATRALVAALEQTDG